MVRTCSFETCFSCVVCFSNKMLAVGLKSVCNEQFAPANKNQEKKLTYFFLFLFGIFRIFFYLKLSDITYY